MRTQNYSPTGSQNAERLARFRQQMADYARGQRLRELRERKHQSQESVAYDLGVSTKTLRAWEHGGKIRWDNAKKLAAFYEVDPELLVSRETFAPEEEEPLPGTQLDRIEQMLTEIRGHLLGAPAEQAPAVAGVADRLLQAAESPRSKADARRGKSRAASRRKSA